MTAIAAGFYHTVSLKNDGTVMAWGWNGSGQTTVPAGLSGVTAIASGYAHTVTLKSDGTVVAWGRNAEGQTTVPGGLSGVTAIAAGGYHSVVLIPLPPSLTLGLTPVDGIEITGATLHGNVNPNSQITTAQFEYGTTPALGSSASVTLSEPDGSDFQSVSAALTGLQPGTTYYYRLAGSSVSGSSATGIQSFTTSGYPDIALEQPEGTVLPNGGGIWFGSADVYGSPVLLPVTIRNTGDVPLTGITAAVDLVPTFSIETPPPATLNPGASAVMVLSFDPSSGGMPLGGMSNHSATLTVTSDDPDESPFILQLGGTGLHPDLRVTVQGGAEVTYFPYNGIYSHPFGRLAVGSSQTFTFRVQNSGPGQLAGTLNFGGGSGYSIAGPSGFNLGQNAFQDYIVTFSPTAAPEELAVAGVFSNDPDNGMASVSFSGSGNTAPVASASLAPGPEDPGLAGIPVALSGSDADGDALVYEIETPPVHGSLSGMPPSGTTYFPPAGPSLVYQPEADFHGDDSFTYRVWDGHEYSNVATVSITVAPVNDPPVVADQSVVTPEDIPLLVDLTATDVDDTVLGYVILTPPSHGTLDLAGAIATYTPDENYHGPDSFTFKASDGHEYQPESQIATVTISVTSVNDAPVTSFEIFSINEDQSLSVALSKSVLKNDSDFHDGAPGESNTPLTAIVVDAPPHAQSFTLNPNGTFTYTPRANWHGLDSFTYRAVDALGGQSDPETVLIAVRAVNDTPAAESLAVSTLEDVPVMLHLRGADIDAAAQFDPDEWFGLVPPASGPAPYDAALVFTITQGPSHGSLSGSAPHLAYTPHADYHGTDTIKFTVSDGLATSAEATVILTIQPDNDADLLPDSWEMIAFASLAWDGGDDPDGDGQNNEFEFIAGHDPDDANSRLVLELAGPSPIDGILRLNHVRPGVIYTLEASADLSTWSVIGNATYEIEGAGAIHDSRGLEFHRQFYRVSVSSE